MTMPRRLPPTPEERLQVVTGGMAAGSAAGLTRAAAPIPNVDAYRLIKTPRATTSGVCWKIPEGPPLTTTATWTGFDTTPIAPWGGGVNPFFLSGKSIYIHTPGVYSFRLYVWVQITVAQQGLKMWMDQFASGGGSYNGKLTGSGQFFWRETGASPNSLQGECTYSPTMYGVSDYVFCNFSPINGGLAAPIIQGNLTATAYFA